MILIREEFSAFSISGSDQEDEQDRWKLRAAIFILIIFVCVHFQFLSILFKTSKYFDKNYDEILNKEKLNKTYMMYIK